MIYRQHIFKLEFKNMNICFLFSMQTAVKSILVCTPLTKNSRSIRYTHAGIYVQYHYFMWGLYISMKRVIEFQSEAGEIQ